VTGPTVKTPSPIQVQCPLSATLLPLCDQPKAGYSNSQTYMKKEAVVWEGGKWTPQPKLDHHLVECCGGERGVGPGRSIYTSRIEGGDDTHRGC
jgi:hypothetical protein